MQSPFITKSISESYHGNLIEVYFARKSGFFRPITRAVEKAACGLFLCFTNRSGSTLLAAEASSLGFCGKPNKYLNYEFFNSEFVIEFCEGNSIYSLQQYVDAICEEFRSPLDIFFTKCSLDQLTWLRRVGVIGVAYPVHRYSRILRQDLIAQSVSYVIAEQTGLWTSVHKPTDRVAIYDGGKISAVLAHISRTEADANLWFNIIDVEPAIFVYEEIALSLTEIGSKLQQLTGIGPLPRRNPTLDIHCQTQQVNLEWCRRFKQEVLTATGVI